MVRDFWNSGAYVISTAIVVGSGIMPTLRIIAFSIVWMVPMGVNARGWLLLAFDMCGRLLFINQCFIIVVVITLNITLEAAGFKISLVAEPILGIIAGTVGMLVGIMQWSWVTYLQSRTAHAIRVELRARPHPHPALPSVDTCTSDLSQHSRYSDASKKSLISPDNEDEWHENETDDWDMWEAEKRRENAIPTFMHSTRLSTASPGTCRLALMLLTCTITAYIGAGVLEVLRFKMGGLAGAADSRMGTGKVVDGVAEVPFSLYGMGLSFPTKTDETTGAAVVSFFFMLLICVAPILCMLTWGYVWIGTCRRDTHTYSIRIARWISPYLYSWCGLDTLFIAIFAGALEMNLPCQWIITNHVGKICDKIQHASGKQCVHVDGAIPPGGWCLLAAAVFSFGLFVMTVKAFGHPALCNQRSGWQG
eukprot:TRINITY_DN25424_c0_g1_i1.p1 TRINITY_DN25424_c0_g1~~TRINITY_DN25424_c0_g1_i1.p1  ORF type:complete len:421 (+),score=99.01 TRINITY_DN25424_c0_g1_i1:216-1478(+)